MQNIFVLANENKKELYQWDTNQRFIITIPGITQAHYYVSAKEEPLSCATYEENGLLVVNIPNILLQKAGNYRVYAYHTDSTIDVFQFSVIARPKPSNYIYTETELVTIDELVQEALQKAKESGLFDGPQGPQGPEGPQGYTPKKGVDYYTEADKKEINNYIDIKSKTQGIGTIADGEASTAMGRYNRANLEALLSVGNGVDENNRFTAFEILKDNSINMFGCQAFKMISVSNPEFTILSDDSDEESPVGKLYRIQITKNLPIIPKTMIYSDGSRGYSNYRDNGEGKILNDDGETIVQVNYNTGDLIFHPYASIDEFELSYSTIQSNLIPTLDPNIEKRIAALEAQLDGLAEFLNKINNGGLE